MRDPENCQHNGGTSIEQGVERWRGNRYTADRVEVCDDCGEVLATYPARG